MSDTDVKSFKDGNKRLKVRGELQDFRKWMYTNKMRAHLLSPVSPHLSVCLSPVCSVQPVMVCVIKCVRRRSSTPWMPLSLSKAALLSKATCISTSAEAVSTAAYISNTRVNTNSSRLHLHPTFCRKEVQLVSYIPLNYDWLHLIFRTDFSVWKSQLFLYNTFGLVFAKHFRPKCSLTCPAVRSVWTGFYKVLKGLVSVSP